MDSIKKIIVLIILAVILLPIVIYSQINLSEKILFDDFIYTSAEFPVSGDSSGSIFASNPWLTEKGIVYTPAWYRWNIGNPEYGPKGSIKMKDFGFSLIMEKGFKPGTSEPMIASGFHFKGGTYAARVKFYRVSMETHFIQAFWLTSPLYFKFKRANEIITYWTEMDFEFNNCFIEKNVLSLQVGCNNYNGKPPRSRQIDCICESNNGKTGISKCNDFYKDQHILTDKWFILAINLDTSAQTLSFSMLSDSSKYPELKIWAGESDNPDDWGIPLKINNYTPEYSLLTMFNLGIFNDGHNAESKNHMDVDWYFYSDDPGMSIDDIKLNVDKLKINNIPRINTTCQSTYPECKSKEPGIITIEGPDSIVCGNSYSWKLKSNYKRYTCFDMIFKYRFIDSEGPEEWVDIYKPDITLTPRNYHTALELVSHAQDHWVDYQTKDTLNVKILSGNCQELPIKLIVSEPYPNPAYLSTKIDYELLADANVSIGLYDVLGKLIELQPEKLLGKGHYSYVFDGIDKPSGIYYCLIKINNEIINKRIQLCKIN